MIKIELKGLGGEVKFTWQSEKNTVKETVEKFLKENIGKLIEKMDLSGLDLSGVSFDNSSFDNSSFYNSSFYNSRFDNSRFYNSRFDNSRFDNSSFYNSRFYNSSFYNSSFYNSSFYNSRFYNSSFYNSRFDDKTILGLKESGQIKMFDFVKHDFWSKLLKLKNEIPAFKEKIKSGQIDGSCYEGKCCCFVGTFANIKGCHYEKLEGVYPDSKSPTESWFMMIKPKMTPENSETVKLTMGWIEEFEMYLNAKTPELV